MARPGFYNENEYRDYPFLTQVMPLDLAAVIVSESSASLDSSGSSASAEPLRDLPHSTIVDFGAIMAVDSGFVTDIDFVWLRRIRRRDPYLLFEFRTTARRASGEKLVFVRQIDDPEFHYQWATSVPTTTPDDFGSLGSEASLSSASEVSGSSNSSFPFCDRSSHGDTTCSGPGCDSPKWEGFLITGLFDDLLEVLADGDELLFPKGLWVIEHARVQNLNGSFVRSINLANRVRTTATPPAGCGSASSAGDDVDAYPNAVCLQGDIRFKEGHNCYIRQEDNTNKLVIMGAVGNGGEGVTCYEIPLYDGESAPMDSPFLSGGPACGETVRTVNGKGGPNLRIYGGPGVRVYEAPDDPSALMVDADLGDFALCLQEELSPDDPCYEGPSASSSSSSSSSQSSGGP